MIPQAPQRKYAPGTRVRVVQHVRVGSQCWSTEIIGAVADEGQRPVGGIEMGAKSAAIAQETLSLRGDDGEITVVAIDEKTEVEAL